MAFVQGFYSDQTVLALTTSYQQFAFGIEAMQVIIQNDDGTNSIYFSWDGVNNHGQLHYGETLPLNTSNYEQIYLKAAAGTPAYRLTAVR
jgi:hypothetical protein